jgi:hypothetical protein
VPCRQHYGLSDRELAKMAFDKKLPQARFKVPTEKIGIDKTYSSIHVAESVGRADYGVGAYLKYVAVGCANTCFVSELGLPRRNDVLADVAKMNGNHRGVHRHATT